MAAVSFVWREETLEERSSLRSSERCKAALFWARVSERVEYSVRKREEVEALSQRRCSSARKESPLLFLKVVSIALRKLGESRISLMRGES